MIKRKGLVDYKNNKITTVPNSFPTIKHARGRVPELKVYKLKVYESFIVSQIRKQMRVNPGRRLIANNLHHNTPRGMQYLLAFTPGAEAMKG